jgi:hypothetical protein
MNTYPEIMKKYLRPHVGMLEILANKHPPKKRILCRKMQLANLKEIYLISKNIHLGLIRGKRPLNSSNDRSLSVIHTLIQLFVMKVTKLR